jgi:cell division septal protein FtsQ
MTEHPMREHPATTEHSRAQAARLWLSWLLVAVLLGYGVVETVITAAKLFTD